MYGSTKLSAVIMVAMTVVQGCGAHPHITDCRTLCEVSRDCDDVNQSVGGDCTGQCSQIESLNAEHSCEAAFDALVRCANEKDVCDSKTCDAELTSWGDCIVPPFSLISCEDLKKLVTSCVSGFCSGDGAPTPACGCWNSGQDINTQTCDCIPLNLDAVCTEEQFFDSSSFSCERLIQNVKGVCAQ